VNTNQGLTKTLQQTPSVHFSKENALHGPALLNGSLGPEKFKSKRYQRKRKEIDTPIFQKSSQKN
jgi:hypothetical protein